METGDVGVCASAIGLLLQVVGEDGQRFCVASWIGFGAQWVAAALQSVAPGALAKSRCFGAPSFLPENVLSNGMASLSK